MAALLGKEADQVTFIVSFTGRYVYQMISYGFEDLEVFIYYCCYNSSVTAGHDSYFNMSTSVQAGLLMSQPFLDLGIKFESRNVALGNNPCTPYDVCVKYFAGTDADIVIWEQTYFCEGKPIIEQFVRQSQLMSNPPVVVFSDSHSGKW
jgi:hypothetical protein